MSALTDLVLLIRKHTNLLFVLILPVYLYIVQNSIQNKHTHVYANGIVVTHSHPTSNTNDSPFNKHNHTHREICLFASFNLDLYETPDFAEFKFETPEVDIDYFISNQKVEAIPVLLHAKPRAPPV